MNARTRRAAMPETPARSQRPAEAVAGCGCMGLAPSLGAPLPARPRTARRVAAAKSTTRRPE